MTGHHAYPFLDTAAPSFDIPGGLPAAPGDPSCELRHDRLKLFHRGLQREPESRIDLSRRPETFPEAGFAGEPRDRLAEGGRIAGRDEQAGLAIADDFDCAACGRGDDRAPAELPLDDDPAEGFRVDGRVRDDVDAGHQARHVLAVAGEAYPLVELQVLREPEQPGLVRVLAEERPTHHQGLRLRPVRQQLQEHMLALPRSQPAEYADDRPRVEAEFAADPCAGFGLVQRGRRAEAVVDHPCLAGLASRADEGAFRRLRIDHDAPCKEP